MARGRWRIEGGKLVDVTDEVKAPDEGLQVRMVDNAHVSHALPRRQDAPGMNWKKFDRKGRPVFTSNEDVREFSRRNPSFARE